MDNASLYAGLFTILLIANLIIDHHRRKLKHENVSLKAKAHYLNSELNEAFSVIRSREEELNNYKRSFQEVVDLLNDIEDEQEEQSEHLFITRNSCK